MPSTARILASIETADRAERFRAVGQLGVIRRRRLRSGDRAYYLDYHPCGGVWSNYGLQISDKGPARRLLESLYRGRHIASVNDRATVVLRKPTKTRLLE